MRQAWQRVVENRWIVGSLDVKWLDALGPFLQFFKYAVLRGALQRLPGLFSGETEPSGLLL